MIKNPFVPIIASLVCIAGLAAMAYAFLELVEVGTCAEGGPFEIARPCPEGTSETVAILVGSIIAYVIAMILLALSSPAGGILMFGLLFTVLGGCFILTELDDARFGGNMGGAGWVCGPVFILLMGLPPIYISFAMWRAKRRGREGESNYILDQLKG